MNSQADRSQLLEHCITETSVPGHPADYRGKVRDIYHLDADRMVIVATDRISAFDHIFNEPIPFKGQLLNKLAWYGFRNVADLCTHHVIDVPHPNVTIARKCRPLPVEVVVRGYLTGYAWRVYREGGRALCGVTMPGGLRQNEAFPEPILTPTTKAKEGHDEDISEAEILSGGHVPEPLWMEIRQTALHLFRRGQEVARKKDLILVDTKYEFGLFRDKLVLIDEVHTADSSRYFYADGYEDRLERGEPQKQLSKEFLREWLIDSGHHATLDQQLPVLPDDVRISIYERYRELYEKLTGETFRPVPTADFNRELEDLLDKLAAS